MKKSFTILLLMCAGIGANAQDKLYPNEFPLSQITLLEGPLKHARDLNIETLLKYDCDRLIAPYRKEAGLTPKAKCYPNWTDWTDMWEDITSQLWRLTQLPAMKNVASAWSTLSMK